MREKPVLKIVKVVEQTPQEFIDELCCTINEEKEDADYLQWIKNNLIVIEVKTETIDVF